MKLFLLSLKKLNTTISYRGKVRKKKYTGDFFMLKCNTSAFSLYLESMRMPPYQGSLDNLNTNQALSSADAWVMLLVI